MKSVPLGARFNLDVAPAPCTPPRAACALPAQGTGLASQTCSSEGVCATFPRDAIRSSPGVSYQAIPSSSFHMLSPWKERAVSPPNTLCPNKLSRANASLFTNMVKRGGGGRDAFGGIHFLPGGRIPSCSTGALP